MTAAIVQKQKTRIGVTLELTCQVIGCSESRVSKDGNIGQRDVVRHVDQEHAQGEECKWHLAKCPEVESTTRWVNLVRSLTNNGERHQRASKVDKGNGPYGPSETNLWDQLTNHNRPKYLQGAAASDKGAEKTTIIQWAGDNAKADCEEDLYASDPRD
ncbi:MAG: hypothetical protein L6R37_000312 [Teloschistes peruensis]|nr:MAG: hypothetical protein L6R37_000312 [Teloschistes peruensis]